VVSEGVDAIVGLQQRWAVRIHQRRQQPRAILIVRQCPAVRLLVRDLLEPSVRIELEPHRSPERAGDHDVGRQPTPRCSPAAVRSDRGCREARVRC